MPPVEIVTQRWPCDVVTYCGLSEAMPAGHFSLGMVLKGVSRHIASASTSREDGASIFGHVGREYLTIG